MFQENAGNRCADDGRKEQLPNARVIAMCPGGRTLKQSIVEEYAEGAADSVWHQYVVRVDDRDAFRAYLLENGVETAVHYATPPYRQTCYAEYAGIDMPVSDEIARTCVSLPISRCTSLDDAMDIAEIVNGYRR